jgi:hypothetical protein
LRGAAGVMYHARPTQCRRSQGLCGEQPGERLARIDHV